MPDTCPHAWTYPRPGVRECWRCGATEMLPQDGELEHHEEPRRYVHQQSGEIIQEGT